MQACSHTPVRVVWGLQGRGSIFPLLSQISSWNTDVFFNTSASIPQGPHFADMLVVTPVAMLLLGQPALNSSGWISQVLSVFFFFFFSFATLMFLVLNSQCNVEWSVLWVAVKAVSVLSEQCNNMCCKAQSGRCEGYWKCSSGSCNAEGKSWSGFGFRLAEKCQAGRDTAFLVLEIPLPHHSIAENQGWADFPGDVAV